MFNVLTWLLLKIVLASCAFIFLQCFVSGTWRVCGCHSLGTALTLREDGGAVGDGGGGRQKKAGLKHLNRIKFTQIVQHGGRGCSVNRSCSPGPPATCTVQPVGPKAPTVRMAYSMAGDTLINEKQNVFKVFITLITFSKVLSLSVSHVISITSGRVLSTPSEAQSTQRMLLPPIYV